MRLVYLAANLIDAQIVNDLLSSERISSKILNQSAIGATGEIPLNQVYPEVWIQQDSDYANARVIIEEFDKHISVEDILCNSCGEYNPGNFEYCWNCHQKVLAHR